MTTAGPEDLKNAYRQYSWKQKSLKNQQAKQKQILIPPPYAQHGSSRTGEPEESVRKEKRLPSQEDGCGRHEMNRAPGQGSLPSRYSSTYTRKLIHRYGLAIPQWARTRIMRNGLRTCP